MIPALALALSVAVAWPAQASAPAQKQEAQQAAPELTDAQKEEARKSLEMIANAFHPIATGFDCSKFITAAFVDKEMRIAQVAYMPQSTEKPEEWERMVTTTVYALPGEKDADLQLMRHMANTLLEQYKKSGKVLDTKTYSNANSNNEPGFYIEYEIGEGKAKEHNAGVFLRIGDKAAGFVQLQTRGKKLSKNDAQRVHDLLKTIGKPPADAAKKQEEKKG